MSTTPKFASFNWLRGVSDDRKISLVHRTVLLRMCLHRRNDGRCDPGCDTLAAEVGVHRSTVFRAIDIGMRRGWLGRRVNHGGRVRQSFELTFPVQQSQPCDGLKRSTVAGQQSQRQRASRAKSKASARNGQRVSEGDAKASPLRVGERHAPTARDLLPLGGSPPLARRPAEKLEKKKPMHGAWVLPSNLRASQRAATKQTPEREFAELVPEAKEESGAATGAGERDAALAELRGLW